MAAVQCTKCTAERKCFRRELDSWRHRLIHCVGFESILEGIYGPLLLRDLSLFDDCEPNEVDDWSPEASCSFCSLPLDKLSDQVHAGTSPLSSPSDYSPCQAPITSESSQSAHRFLQAVFQKKDVPLACDSNIPLIAQELMRKMIHQFALEYASKCVLHTNANGVTRTSSPASETSDAPLDLTVSRAQDEKESEPGPDGVLDLSNRNPACSATSSSSSSSNHKASGSLLPLLTEDLGLRGTRFRQSSALAAVLSSLCLTHQSLLYQILKLAHQEMSLSFVNHRPVGQTECHCDVKPQNNITPHSFAFSEFKDQNRSLCLTLSDCDHQSNGSAVYHPEDSKSSCSIHHHKDCNREGQHGSSYCCVQKCRMETYTVLCSKSLHCMSCQRLTTSCMNNRASSFASSHPLSQSHSLCTPSSGLCISSSICCNQHNCHACPKLPNHTCLTHARHTREKGAGDGDPPCPVLNREQSPSPPPLSPIPSDISKKTDEKPPFLLCHRQEEEIEVIVKSGPVSPSLQEADVETATAHELYSKSPESGQTEQNPSGTLLQVVMNRFSEKLETIRPLDKDPTLVSTTIYVSEKEQLPSPSTSQNQLHGDAHLTEIITTVLHTGSASDYSLSELFKRHDNGTKSPKTRLRCRQEVLAALATPADDASTRRHTRQIKRELAMLDQSCNKRKVPPAKKARLKDDNVTITTSCTKSDQLKNVSTRDTEDGVESHSISEGSLNMLCGESSKVVKEEMQTAAVTEEVQIIKEREEKEKEISRDENSFSLSGTIVHTFNLESKHGEQVSSSDAVLNQDITGTVTSVKSCGGPCEEIGECNGSEHGSHEEAPSGQSTNTDTPGKDFHGKDTQICQSNHFEVVRRSRRTIVPPQRFSSYVTESRISKMFVECFANKIFNHGALKDTDLTASTLHALSKDPDAKDSQLESEKEVSSEEHTGKLIFASTQNKQCEPSCTRSKNQRQVVPQTLAAKKNSPKKQHNSDNRTDDNDCAAMLSGRLRSSPKRLQLSRLHQNPSSIKSATCVESPPSTLYTSPIKLMFFSPVKDKKGVKYSLKSAGSGSGTQGGESFDPCEESSWSGTPEKHKTQSSESATSQVKSVLSPRKTATSREEQSASSPAKSTSSPAKSTSSPAKSTSSPAKSTSSPAKSTSSPAKSTSSPAKSTSSPAKSTSSPAKPASPLAKPASSPAKSASSPAKSASSPARSASSPAKSASSPAKSACSTPRSTAKSPCSPSKCASSPRSTSSSPKNGSRRSGEVTPNKRVAATGIQGSPCFLETTPPKRRPGRPKKLGPQLEQKAKRPIGRPRKLKSVDLVTGAKTLNGKCPLASDAEENVNRNLKITVVYGRSRRNKRMVSEGCGELQTEFNDACQAMGLKSDLGILLHNSKTRTSSIITASEELNFVSPAKEPSAQSSSIIKCQKRGDPLPSRKPGRPAKVKISGISVTVTTVSPRQRKIQINKDNGNSSETLIHKKVLPELKSAKEPRTISHQLPSQSQMEEGIEAKDEGKDKHQNQPVAVRHSMRVRKPSIHFLHAVATSTLRSYKHSNALLRRSKQLLLTKANNERRLEEQQSSVVASREERQLCNQERSSISQNMNRAAGVSVDSIFTPKKTLRWWAASAEEKSMNQELARRIRVISDTWVSDTVENQEKEMPLNCKQGTKGKSAFTKKSKHSSVVRTLFDCSPNKPRSCSMQQICSWFMQTTETQSLAIVKKASSRSPSELLLFPRSANKKTVCPSPQAERLRKHIKKFAKTVPKSPLQHQRLLRKRNRACLPTHIRRQLFTSSFVMDTFSRQVQRLSGRASSKYQDILVRARTRFFTRKERERWLKRQRNRKPINISKSCSNGHVVTGLKLKHKAFRRCAKAGFSGCLENGSTTSGLDQTWEPVDLHKEQNLCSKAWSPESLKECRVFLRKINSPDNESAEEEWDSCTVTLDDGSPSAFLFSGREKELVGVVKAVKTERKRSMNRRTASRERAGPQPKPVQEHDAMPAGRQKGKYKSPGVSSEPPQPPPAKMLRQSRMKRLTGPRWCDFVLEN
ncbi:uncharacterized protein lcorl isoform X2 [Mugil cephalus]|uniref:uncharacterized protein lcorl isoform X2 n=1 Tax=Mugil cephalus TaxID=48193 RepID=UPI001FB6A9BA|nr:uncharacterized protein lcorl isoform X2 [Mugil cephalus]